MARRPSAPPNRERGWVSLPDLIIRLVGARRRYGSPLTEERWLDPQANPFRLVAPFARGLDRRRSRGWDWVGGEPELPYWDCTERKARLLATAVAHRATRWIPDVPERRPFVELIRLGESHADGLATDGRLRAVYARLHRICAVPGDPAGSVRRGYAARVSRGLGSRPHVTRGVAVRHAMEAALDAVFRFITDDEFEPFELRSVMSDALVAAGAGEAGCDARRGSAGLAAGTSAESRAMAEMVRDVFGNPFRPVTFDPAWRTEDAVLLAKGMYESRDFSAMPILADALQDAGCDDERVLAHCRGPQQVHVRGCWVADLVLGKT
jgi:hypothetical protein